MNSKKTITKKLNVLIVLLTIIILTVEIIKGDYPWKVTKFDLDATTKGIGINHQSNKEYPLNRSYRHN